MVDFEKKIDGFKFSYNNIHSDPGGHYQTIVLDDRKQFKKALNYILEKKINQVEIRHEIDDADIKALLELESIPLRCLAIEQASKRVSLSPLNELVSLECLMITSQQKGVINFKELTNLKEFYSGSANIVLDNFDCATNLVRLTLQNYNNKDLPVLKSTNLKSVTIDFSNFKYLNFLSECSNIEDVSIVAAPKLAGLNELLASKDTIKELSLTKCGKMQDYSILRSLTAIEYLRLLRCGSLRSTYYLEKLSSLKYANIDIDIKDGDVNAILDKPIVFRYHKHFCAKTQHRIQLGMDGLVYLYKGENPLYSIS